jgi:ferrous iron transport protein B
MSCNHCPKTCSARTLRPQTSRRNWFGRRRDRDADISAPLPTVALVGSPNVGKSVLFNALTSRYVTVSNYPGTTVDVSRGQMQVGETAIAVLDTPGMYSLLPITEEERVGRDLLLASPPDLAVHVVDAKHLGRMLNFTLQLIEAGLPVLLVVNLIDEAYQLGIEIDAGRLQKQLGIPVVLTAAARNIGVQELKGKVADYVESSQIPAGGRNRDRSDRVPAGGR